MDFNFLFFYKAIGPTVYQGRYKKQVIKFNICLTYFPPPYSFSLLSHFSTCTVGARLLLQHNFICQAPLISIELELLRLLYQLLFLLCELDWNDHLVNQFTSRDASSVLAFLVENSVSNFFCSMLCERQLGNSTVAIY